MQIIPTLPFLCLHIMAKIINRNIWATFSGHHLNLAWKIIQENSVLPLLIRLAATIKLPTKNTFS